MRIGVNISINVSKIDKERMFKGKKGTYLDLTTFIDTDNKDQYDNNGFIKQSTTAEERGKGINLPILGNCRVFYTDAPSNYTPANRGSEPPYGTQPGDGNEDDIPF